jgi:uncharacterized protein (DUF58 family)
MANAGDQISGDGNSELEGQNGVYIQLTDLVSLRWQAKSLALPKARTVSRPQSGSHHSRFRGRGMEFSEVRVYQPGDDVRSIDWRVTARRQKPHTKLFDEERERPVLIVCDQSQSMFFGSQVQFKSVLAARIAALFAWTTLAHNDRVGGIVFSNKGHEEIRPARNRKNILRLLSTIERFNHQLKIEALDTNNTATSEAMVNHLSNALAETARVAKPGTLVILISDLLQLDDNCETHLANISRHNQVLMIQTTDALEAILPEKGTYPINVEAGQQVLNTSDSQLVKEFTQWRAQQNDRIDQTAKRHRASLMRIQTDEDPSVSLRQVIQAVGR